MSENLPGDRPEGEATTLQFVYNVDASPVNLLRDLVTGVRTGVTDCHLCDLTFGTLLKDPTWKRFVDELPIKVDFCLRSTFAKRYPQLSEGPFPAGFFIDGDAEPVEVLSAKAMSAAGDLDALRVLVSDAVSQPR